MLRRRLRVAYHGALKQIKREYGQILRKDDEHWVKNAQLYEAKGSKRKT